MADTKITDLAAGTPALAADEFPINRAGLDRKLTVGDLSGRLLSKQTYTAVGAATWTAPAGLSFVIVECLGGGASGSGSGLGLGASGGGAGGYTVRRLAAATVGASQTATVGSGGAVGATGATGAVGGSSTFGTLLIACGGNPGITGIFGIGGSGGLALCGDFLVQGGDGGPGFNPGISGLAIVTGSRAGEGGASVMGGGGGAVARGFTGAGTAGQPGSALGSGGGGGSSLQASGNIGGAGAPGLIVVWEYI